MLSIRAGAGKIPEIKGKIMQFAKVGTAFRRDVSGDGALSGFHPYLAFSRNHQIDLSALVYVVLLFLVYFTQCGI